MNFLIYMSAVLFLLILIFLYPFVAILRSEFVQGRRKIIWAILTLIFSWLVFFPYLLIEEKWFTE